ncbi:MAG: hypothetical protein ABH851_03710 [Methanobacteriota archaeon]
MVLKEEKPVGKSCKVFQDFRSSRIFERDILRFYQERGLQIPETLTAQGEPLPCHFEVSTNAIWGEKYQCNAFLEQGFNQLGRTWLEIYETERGLLIENAQTKPYIMDSPHRRFYNRVLDSFIGERVCLDLLKCVAEDRDLFILAPHEVRKMFGKKSYYGLWNSNFWKHVRGEHPDEFTGLLARALYEDPGQDQSMLTGYALLTGEEIAAAHAIRDASGYSPGGRLLSRVQDEFLGTLTAKKPLGVRRSRRYYREIPMQHGFKPEYHVDFGGNQTFDVLHYNPAEDPNQTTQGFRRLLHTLKY